MTSPRPDTRYLATSPITTDLGQRLTNLTVAAPGGYEANSARTAIDGTGAGRSIELKCDVDTATGGVLVDHNNGAGYRITVGAAGTITFSDTNGTLKSITAPNVGALAQAYVIAWSTEPNPLTTGAADALRSEFLVYDVAGTTLSWDTAEHAVAAASNTGTFTVAGVYTGGVMTLTYAPGVDAVRISMRFHTRVETREHFVSATPLATILGVKACQTIPLPAEVIAAGQIVGPGYQFAAASMQVTRDRHRLVSPIWQWLAPEQPSLADDMKDTISYKLVLDMPELGVGWQQPLCWLARRRIPRHVAHVLVRIQWATWETAPGVTDKVELQFHCADGPPNSYVKMRSQLISRQVDDGASGLGVNQSFDFVRVERDAEGYTWLWMTARTDEGSGAGNATYQVRSCSVTPVVLEEGYGGEVPNPWGP